MLRPGGHLLLTTPNPHFYLVNITVISFLASHADQEGFASTRVTGSGNVSRHLGERFPLFNVYGSYLAVSQKG